MKKLAILFVFGIGILVTPAVFGKEPNETLNLLETVTRQLQSGERTKDQLKDFVAGRNPFEKKTNKSIFSVWKTIQLGTGLKTTGDFRRALTEGEYRISNWASDILGKPAFIVATKKIKLDLVKVSVEELGFNQGAMRQQIYERAQEHGLKLCPAEVGPQLRLQYSDQPYKEWLVVAMEPIILSDGGLVVFGVEYGSGGQLLEGYRGDPDFLWYGDYQFVFCN